MLVGVEIWGLYDRYHQTLAGAHLQMVRTIQCLPQNVAKAGVLIDIEWVTVLTVIYKSCCVFMGRILNAALTQLKRG